jgi:hypothetical protein
VEIVIKLIRGCRGEQTTLRYTGCPRIMFPHCFMLSSFIYSIKVATKNGSTEMPSNVHIGYVQNDRPYTQTQSSVPNHRSANSRSVVVLLLAVPYLCWI